MIGSWPPNGRYTGRPWLPVVLVIISTSLIALSAQETQRGSVDWILVLDTSASMRGVGPSAKNIFDKVKSTLGDFISSTKEGDAVIVYTFDEDVKLQARVSITGDIDKRDLLKTINNLQATGKRTYTGKAIHDALERANELLGRSGSSQRTISIVLFTDGLEDVRGIPNPISIPSNVSLVPKDRSYIFFVSLGEHEHEKQLEEFVKNPALAGIGEVVRDPGAAGIKEVGDRIRKKIDAPAPPAEVKVSVEPDSLDFGQIEPGATTGRLALTARSSASTRARVALDDSSDKGIVLVEPKEEVELKTDEATVIKVQLVVASDLPDGARSVRLIVAPQNLAIGATAISGLANARLSLLRVPIWRKALKWLSVFLLLALVALAVVSFLRGEMPSSMWHKWKERNYLEGELEVLQPRAAQAEDEFISLTRLGRERATLSALLSAATDGSDAELQSTRKNGSKLIRLCRLQGVIRVNKAEVAIVDLYDGDMIEIGEARLRFNWVGHERPTEADEEV